MGRYYHGDIEGKFMFAVQPSNAADRFGVTGYAGPLQYYFTGKDIPDVEAELEEIEDQFGELKHCLLAYFDLYETPEDAPITFTEYLEKGGKPKLNEALFSEYADYILGKKILKCLQQHDECNFEAEI